MENENKENKENIILTDEQLKEVAGGTLSPLNNLGNEKALECIRTTDVKECFEKKYCIWKDGKCFPKI